MTPAKKIDDFKWMPIGNQIVPKEQSMSSVLSSIEAGTKTYREIKDLTFLIPHELYKCTVFEADHANESYSVTVQNDYTGVMQINVIDLTGKVLLEGTVNKQNFRLKMHISIRGLKPGLYLLEVVTEEDIAIERIVIK
jgi:hypothetical protein